MILVAYASRHGATREIAEAVAEALHGQAVPAHEVESLDGYEAVVLGAALYIGRPCGEARRFLRTHRRALSERPVAVFGSGPLKLDDAEVESSRRQLERALARFPELRLVAVDVFGGVLRPAELRFPFNRMREGDARDWDAIRAWAEHVGGLLREPALSSASWASARRAPEVARATRAGAAGGGRRTRP